MIELKVFNGMFYASHNDRLLPIKSRLYPSGQVTLNELKVDSKLDEGYFPLGFIEISSFSNFRFLPFVLLSEKKILFVLWRLDKNFSYLSQIKISQAELKLLFRLNVNEDNINQPISCLNLDLGSHVLAIRNKLVPKRNIDEYRFSDEYYNSGYDRASSALDFVFDGVDCNNWKELENNLLNFYNQNEKDNAKVNKTLTKWENLCALGLPKEDKFIPGTVSMFRYDYLRELLAIEYRKDVLYNPITRSHQFCASSRFFFVNGSKEILGKFCVSYYKDIPLVEFRAGGWSCSTFAYQFGDYFTWELRKSHVTWPIDSNKLVTRHAETLNQSLNTPCISPSQKSLVLNSSTQSNLGHFLWNDLSGIHNASQCLDPEFVEMGCIDIGKKGFSGTEGYQSFAIRASLYPKNTKIYDKNSILELTLHTNPIIIKSLVFSPDLASAIKKNSSKLILPKILEDEYCILKSPHLIKILFNIRVHNKSWLNISECLDHFLPVHLTLSI